MKQNDGSRTMLFTMGLPASGKSTWIAENLADARQVIDPDAFKMAHPDYDPNDPAALHEWSNEVAEAMFAAILQNAEGSGVWVIDGTGVNAEKMARRMTQARRAGFEVGLAYIRVSLETSLERNAARERTVPEHVIRSKARDIATSLEIVKSYADWYEIHEND